MLNRVNFKLLMVAVLFLVSTMTFAQDVPFQVQVVAQVARMRWGPGPTFVVQHYANSGHILTILEVDATSDPPWTWYYARTPSNVESWIRSDLVRRDTSGAAAQVSDNPTGSYPVVFDNLCNTTLFRPCQEGTDHLLWQAGYWAFDRYETWEHDGRNLDIVFHENACKAERLCSTREQWDAGLLEAQLLAGTATPDVTLTPVAIQVTRVVEKVVNRVTLRGEAAMQLLDRGGTTPAELYTPPAQVGTAGITGTLIGKFKFDSEKVRVTCQYWHNADQAPTDFVKSKKFDVKEFDENDEDYDVKCLSGNIDDTDANSDVVARQWKMTVTRKYTGLGRIRNVSWKLTATFGIDKPTDTCVNNDGDPLPSSTCKTALDPNVEMYLKDVRSNVMDTPQPIPDVVITPDNSLCKARKTTEGEPQREITRYEHTCRIETTDGTLQHELTLHFTHDKTEKFLQPTPVPTQE